MLHVDYTHAYNHHRRHSALGYLTPAAFAAALEVTNDNRIKQGVL